MLVKKIKNNLFVRDSIVLGMGAALGQGAFALCSPWLTRLYSPEAFGQLAIFLSIVGVVSTLVTLRLDVRIIPAASQDEALHLLIGVILLSFCFSPLLFFFLCFVAQFLPEPIENLLASGVLMIGLVLVSACTAVCNSFLQWLNRQQQFFWVSLIRVGQGISLALAALLMGSFGYAYGLVVAQAISVFIPIFFLMFYLYSLHENIFLSAAIKQLFKNRNTAYYLLPAALLDIVSLQVPVLLISSLFSSGEAGQFSLAWRILAAPLFVVGGAVGQVFFQRASQNGETVAGLRLRLFKTWRSLMLLGLLPFFVLFFVGKEIFSFVFGEKWAVAGEMAVILSPALFAMFVSSPTSSFYIIMNFQKGSLFFSFLSFLLRVFSLTLGYVLNSLMIALVVFSVFEVLQIIFYNVVGLQKLDGRK